MPSEEEFLHAFIMKKVETEETALSYPSAWRGHRAALNSKGRFKLDNYTDANCELEFRFDVAGLQRLCVLFRVRDVVITAHRDRVAGIEALCIMLRRLAYPQRYYELLERFGRSRSALSRIFLHMIDHVHDKFAERIFFAQILVETRMQRYCDAIADKGSPVDSVFGFPDGTKLRVCRPSPRPGAVGENLQKFCYSGHKRCHCINYQAVTAPDGMCIHFWGPMEGRRHDIAMLRESKLIQHFDDHPSVFAGRFLYGDPAYGVQKYMLSGYKGNVSDPFERAFNKEMREECENLSNGTSNA